MFIRQPLILRNHAFSKFLTYNMTDNLIVLLCFKCYLPFITTSHKELKLGRPTNM